MTMKFITVRRPNVDKAAVIRADLKARGIKANVRYFNSSYRIVLPVASVEARAALRDYLVEHDLSLSGSYQSATDRAAYDRAWSMYEGRGQIFVCDAR